MDLTKNPRRAATARRLRALWSHLAPRRRPRPDYAPESSPAAELGAPLRAFRSAALWAIAILTATAVSAAFAESYRGLFEWAEHHSLYGFWGAAFPLAIDVFIVIGEAALFVAMLDEWTWQDRLGAWMVALLGLAVSISGNVGHIQAHDLQTRATAAVPPLAAFAALWLGLGVLKRILRYRRKTAETAAQDARQDIERDAIAAALDELSGAVLLIATQAAEPVPAVPDHSALLAELTATVKMLAERPADAVPPAVPDSAESAALASYRATALAGNPWSQRQMELRFGTTRGQFARMRDEVAAELSQDGEPGTPGAIRYMELNGAAAGG